MARAILLLSGGLDSTLAGKVLLELGVGVEAISFVSPFCRCTPKSLGCPAAKRSAEQLGIPVRLVACGEEYLEAMKHPRFGRGRNMNACLDCRIHMFSRARAYMAERGADFVATGEVLGERPMSQHRRALGLIEREAGLEGLIVRPLSAQLLPPSLPEQQGLVDRERLLAIEGRCRRPQIQLARELGIRDYLCPAGGCLLTDREFAARFRDLLEHEPAFTIHDANLLRHGRHFRLPSGTKAIVGRDEEDNTAIERLARAGDTLLVPSGVQGPSALCRGSADPNDIALAAALICAHIKGGLRADVAVQAAGQPGTAHVLPAVDPLDRDTIAAWRVGYRAGAQARRTGPIGPICPIGPILLPRTS